MSDKFKNLNNKQKIIIACIISIVILMICTVLAFITMQKPNSSKKDDSVVIPVGPTEDDLSWLPSGWDLYDLKELWLERKNINYDYKGEIKFESGLVDQPVVQATSIYDREGEFYPIYTMAGHKVTEDERNTGCDGVACTGNDVYLWTYWETMEYDRYEHGGTVFMDYRTDVSDQNIIIYGHHFSLGTEEERMKVGFTPFEKLMDQKNFKNNRKLWLMLDGEMREYEIAVVYEASLTASGDVYIVDPETPYYYTSYTKEEFEEYYDHIKKIQLYDTMVDLKYTDRLLTLQTCIANRPNKRLIILCREVSRHMI